MSGEDSALHLGEGRTECNTWGRGGLSAASRGMGDSVQYPGDGRTQRSTHGRGGLSTAPRRGLSAAPRGLSAAPGRGLSESPATQAPPTRPWSPASLGPPWPPLPAPPPASSPTRRKSCASRSVVRGGASVWAGLPGSHGASVISRGRRDFLFSVPPHPPCQFLPCCGWGFLFSLPCAVNHSSLEVGLPVFFPFTPYCQSSPLLWAGVSVPLTTPATHQHFTRGGTSLLPPSKALPRHLTSPPVPQAPPPSRACDDVITPRPPAQDFYAAAETRGCRSPGANMQMSAPQRPETEGEGGE